MPPAAAPLSVDSARPPFSKGDYRGVLHALIQRWIPPSSPPWKRGDGPRSQALVIDKHIFSHLQGCRGGLLPGREGPTPEG
jgi:hypothetical protein